MQNQPVKDLIAAVEIKLVKIKVEFWIFQPGQMLYQL